MYVSWPCPLPDGRSGEESALRFDAGRASCVLVLPALFDEANKMRHLTVETMRLLDAAGIDSVLPDLPGCNESRVPMEQQSLAGWRAAAKAAAEHFEVTHVLAIRGGALIAPDTLPGWTYAPVKSQNILRGLIRARVVAAREAGRNETSDGLMEQARTDGIELAGWQLGPVLARELEADDSLSTSHHAIITTQMAGGSPLWLRAEPDHDAGQAQALASLAAAGIEAGA